MILARAILLIITILFAWITSLQVRRRSMLYGLLFVFLSLALFTEVYGIITNRLNINNTQLYNVFFIVDTLVFLYVVSTTEYFRNMLLGVVGILFIGAFAYSATVTNFKTEFLMSGILFSGCIIVIISLFVMYRIASSIEKRLLRIPLFWFFLGSLIYFGGIIPFLGAEQLAHEIDRAWATMLYTIVPFSAMLRYVFIGYCCILERRLISTSNGLT